MVGIIARQESVPPYLVVTTLVVYPDAILAFDHCIVPDLIVV